MGRRRGWPRWAWVLWPALGFGGCSEPSPSAASPASVPKRAPKQAEAKPSQAPEPAEPPELRQTLRRGAEGGLQLSVQNRDREPVALSNVWILERAQESGQESRFEAMEGARLSLRYDCERPPERCVTLWPGGELLPPAVRLDEHPVQCGCDDCQPLPAGRYRAVIRGCHEDFTVRSSGFSVDRVRHQARTQTEPE